VEQQKKKEMLITFSIIIQVLFYKLGELSIMHPKVVPVIII